jgi:membrane protein YqaA with SNARE-associated domain
MKSLLASIYAFATAIGGPGLFLIALLDSSFLSFPQANDVLVALMTAREPEWMPYYAGLTVLGSLAGCQALYEVARRGGEAFLRKRVEAGRVDWGIRQFDRFGLLAVLVPSILPPPTPFKLFVLLSGVAQMSRWKFVAAVVLGRGIRYFGIGLLAVWYGEQALTYLETNGRTVLRVIGLAALLGVGIYLVLKRRRARLDGPPRPGAAADPGAVKP